MRYTLQKSEIVRGLHNFQEIFSKGKKFEGNLLTCFVIANPSADPLVEPKVKVGFAVKRNVRKAVDRNRIKRQMRESYRLNKELILSRMTDSSSTISMVFLYSPKQYVPHDLPTSSLVANDMKSILTLVAQTVS